MKQIIMVVDDEPVVLGFIKELLSMHNYSVEAYNNGSDAYNAFQKNPEQYSLVITDQTMPGMLGIELIQKISLIKNIKMILCSGYSDHIDRDAAIKLGASVYLNKPFASKELLAIIDLMMSDKD